MSAFIAFGACLAVAFVISALRDTLSGPGWWWVSLLLLIAGFVALGIGIEHAYG